MTAAPRARGGLGVATIAFALLLPFAMLVGAPAASAAPAMPGGLTPSGGVVSNTPTLGWSRVDGATKYDVQIDDDSAFGSPAFTASTTNNRIVSDKVLPGRTHWWRVRAVSSTGASAWSVTTIEVSAVGVPTPISPLGEELQPPNDVPLLTWEGVAGATSYTVQVDETDDFISPLSAAQTRVTSYAAGPLPKGSYYWRVQATRASGVDSDWSATAAFSVAQLPQVTVVSPADDPDFPVTDVVLDWAPLPGAAYYQLQVSTDTDFNTLVDPKGGAVGSTTKVYSSAYSPKVTYDNNQYYWRVRAVDTAGQPAPWSEIQAQFDRVWNDRPEAVYPLGGDSPITRISGDPYFQWTPAKHATQYELQLGTDANFSPGTTRNCQTAGTTYTAGAFAINHVSGSAQVRGHEVCTPTPGVVYYWRVRPLDMLGGSPLIEGLYSEPQKFIYEDSVISDSGMAPANGETVDVPTLTWSPITDAAKYAITIRNASGSTVKTATTASTSYTPLVSSALTPEKGPYTWTLSATSADGRAVSLIHEGTFQVSGNLPESTSDPLTPLTGNDPTQTTLRAPSLSWVPDPGAKTYRLFVGPHGSGTFFTHASGDVLEQALTYPAVTDTSIRFLVPGSYDWQVRAYDATGTVVNTGPLATFRIAQLSPVTGQRLALDGSGLDADTACDNRIGDEDDTCDGVPATPVFDWDPVEGASLYVLYLSEDSSFSNLVEPLSSLGATSGTRFTPTLSSLRTALPDSQAGGAYYWYVRPCTAPTVCGPSPVSTTGAATNKFRKRSLAVELTSPQDTATVTDPDVTLTWQDYRDTNAAATWTGTGEHPSQSAMSYRVQVDNDSTFTSPLDTVEVDQPTHTAADRTYPDGLLFWRVQAIDAEGNALTWSKPREFTKTTTAPTPASPEGGAVVPGTAVFRWEPLAFTGSYDLEVYKNGDTAASSVNRVLTASTKQAAWVPATPLPASPSDYVWRVRRRDATGAQNPGAWSGWRRFRSAGAAPTLLAPGNATLQNANGPLFSWTPVPGAATYRVEVMNSSGGNLSGTPKTTPSTAWATLAKVPDGTWKWRVVALDAGSTPAALGTSEWRTFNVDGTVPVVTSLSPTSPTPTTSFTARFSEPVKNVSATTFRIRRSGTSTYIGSVVSVTSDRLRAVLNPRTNLRRGATYVITMTSTVSDLNGNRMVAKSWTVRVR
jgi:hypothetical protein